jgi:hypothetical protein
MLSPAAIVRHTRQNHALEHATVHLLSRAFPGVRLMARSGPRGFTLVGEVPSTAVRAAVEEGIRRLAHQEQWLATHPLCGTNVAVAALVLGGAAFAAGILPARSRGIKLLRGALAFALAWPLAQQAGPFAQTHLTTTPQVADAFVIDVRSERRGSLLVHRVLLGHTQ